MRLGKVVLAIQYRRDHPVRLIEPPFGDCDLCPPERRIEVSRFALRHLLEQRIRFFELPLTKKLDRLT